MAYLSQKTIRRRKKYVKEIIRLKGFWFWYYSLNKEDSMLSERFEFNRKEDKYKEFFKFKIKGILNVEQGGYETAPMFENQAGLRINTSLNEAYLYVKTPYFGTNDEYKNYNELEEEDKDLLDSILPVIPQKGDYIKFPIVNPEEIETFNKIKIPTFYEITNVIPNAFYNLYAYKLTLLLRPYILEEEQVSLRIIDLTDKDPTSSYLANRLRGERGVGYGELDTQHKETFEQLKEETKEKIKEENITIYERYKVNLEEEENR